MEEDKRNFIFERPNPGEEDDLKSKPGIHSTPGKEDPPELSPHFPYNPYENKQRGFDPKEEEDLKFLEFLQKLSNSKGRDEKLPKFHGKEGEDIIKFFKDVAKVQTYNQWTPDSSHSSGN